MFQIWNVLSQVQPIQGEWQDGKAHGRGSYSWMYRRLSNRLVMVLGSFFPPPILQQYLRCVLVYLFLSCGLDVFILLGLGSSTFAGERNPQIDGLFPKCFFQPMGLWPQIWQLCKILMKRFLIILGTWESRVFYSIIVSTIQSNCAHTFQLQIQKHRRSRSEEWGHGTYTSKQCEARVAVEKKLCLSTKQPALLAFVLGWHMPSVTCLLKSYETDTNLVDGMQCTNIHQSVFWYLLFTPGSVQGKAERCIWRLHEVKVCGWLAKWPQARPSCRGPQVK